MDTFSLLHKVLLDSADLDSRHFKKGRQIGIVPDLAGLSKGSRGDDARELILLTGRVKAPGEKLELP